MSADHRPAFDPLDPPKRAITVDVVVFTVIEGSLRAFLQPRAVAPDVPFPGLLALPGTFVGDDEELLETAQRVLRDKVGLEVDPDRLSRCGIHDRPDRDPRMRTISVAFTVFVAGTEHRRFIDGAMATGALHVVSDLIDDRIEGVSEPLAFDHLHILTEAREHARVLLEETDAALDLLPPVFTLTQLRGVYDAVWGTALDPGNFIKRVTRIEGFIEQLPAATDTAGVAEADGSRSPQSVPDPGWVVYENLPMSAPESAAEALAAIEFTIAPDPPSSLSKPLGRPPRRFRSAGETKLHPPLRRPGSYFSRSSSTR